ncbi:MAG: glycosyltransferase [Bacteroidales bacterium]|nr:glycosyltransferase [Bacteroidales bacterium]
MKVIQINTSVNAGSTGRIMEDLGRLLMVNGHESYCAYGRVSNGSKSLLIKVGNRKDLLLHIARTRITDRHGFGSTDATRSLIQNIDGIKPDIIHLHNIHGYYLNIRVLFEYLKESNTPLVWTFHDCWPFTGHCSYFDNVNCFKWQSECHNCPNLRGYPASWLADSSRKNFNQKRELFTGLRRAVLVSPSDWLSNQLGNSFLKDYPVKVINNGIDLTIFKPGSEMIKKEEYFSDCRKLIIGVASIWDKRKGLTDFIKLRSMLSPEIGILLVGLSDQQQRQLPKGIKGISRISSIHDLAQLYSVSDLFVNPTYVDNFPTVNIEALACGTPVVTYNTGGSPEIVDSDTGFVVLKGSVHKLAIAIEAMLDSTNSNIGIKCRERAIKLYDKNQRYSEYLNLYYEVLG